MESEANLDKIGMDVDHEIRNRMDEVARIHRCGDADRKSLETVLRNEADRLFLWVTLVFEELRRTKRSSPQHLRSIINKMPGNWLDIYTRFLFTLDDEDRQDAALMLRVIAGAFKPLKLEEFGLAMSVVRIS